MCMVALLDTLALLDTVVFQYASASIGCGFLLSGCSVGGKVTSGTFLSEDPHCLDTPCMTTRSDGQVVVPTVLLLAQAISFLRRLLPMCHTSKAWKIPGKISFIIDPMPVCLSVTKSPTSSFTSLTRMPNNS